MDQVERQVLSQMRGRLVEEMVVTESFLCAFCDCHVLDEQMARLLKSESNYEQRASKLLEVLPGRGTRAFPALLELLEVSNPWLAESMKAALHQLRTKDAKVNLHPSPQHNGMPESCGQSRLTVEPDISERAERWVREQLRHLTEADQRRTERWLAEQLQRERRRLEFKLRLRSSRQAQDYQASKESQTETSCLELLELYEDMMVYLHGSDYREIPPTQFSFAKLHQKMKDLLQRTRKLDALFLNCVDKFEDSDKYGTPLPVLIDRTVSQAKQLARAASEERVVLERVTQERDTSRRHVEMLEEELDKVLKKLALAQKKQKLPSNHKDYRISSTHRGSITDREDSQQRVLNRGERTGSTSARNVRLPSREVSFHGQSMANPGKTISNSGLRRSFENPDQSYRNCQMAKHDFVDAANKYRYRKKYDRSPARDESGSGHTEEVKAVPNSVFRAMKSEVQSPTFSVTVHQADSQDQAGQSTSQHNDLTDSANVKLRRCASEESLKITKSTEKAEIVSMSPLRVNGPRVAGRKGLNDTVRLRATSPGSQMVNSRGRECHSHSKVAINRQESQTKAQDRPSLSNIGTVLPTNACCAGSDQDMYSTVQVQTDQELHSKESSVVLASYESVVGADRNIENHALSPASSVQISLKSSSASIKSSSTSESNQPQALHRSEYTSSNKIQQPSTHSAPDTRRYQTPVRSRSSPSFSRTQLPQLGTQHSPLAEQSQRWQQQHHVQGSSRKSPSTQQQNHHMQPLDQTPRLSTGTRQASPHSRGRSRDPQKIFCRDTVDSSSHGDTPDTETRQPSAAGATIVGDTHENGRVRFVSPVSRNTANISGQRP